MFKQFLIQQGNEVALKDRLLWFAALQMMKSF